MKKKSSYTKSPIEAGSVYRAYDIIYNPLLGVRNSLKARTRLVSNVLSILNLPRGFTSIDLMSGKGETSTALSTLDTDAELHDLDYEDFPGRFADSTFYKRNALDLDDFSVGQFNVAWLVHNNLSELFAGEPNLISAIPEISKFLQDISRIADTLVLELDYSFLAYPVDPVNVKIPKEYLYNLEGKSAKAKATVDQYYYPTTSHILWDINVNTGSNVIHYEPVEVLHVPISILYPLLCKYFDVTAYSITGKKLTLVEEHQIEAGYEPTVFICNAFLGLKGGPNAT